MGTKGCSLAPYFAKQLVEKLKGTENIEPPWQISCRFEKIFAESRRGIDVTIILIS